MIKKINMSISAKYNKLKNLGLSRLGLQVEDHIINDMDKNNICTYSYNCTRIYRKDMERFLFKLPQKYMEGKNSIILLRNFGRHIFNYFVEVEKADAVRHCVVYITKSLVSTHENILYSLENNSRVNFKVRDFDLIDEQEKHQRALMKVADGQDDSKKEIYESINKIMLEKLKYYLGFEEPPSLCGELIALQKIAENLSWYEHGEEGLEALIKYTDPDRMALFNNVKKIKEIYSLTDEKIYPKGIAPLVTINFLDRLDVINNGNGLKLFLEALLDFFPQYSEDSLEQRNRSSVETILKKYYPDSSNKTKESSKRSSQDKSLGIRDRRKLINTIAKLDLFSDPQKRTDFLKLMGVDTTNFPTFDSEILKISITLLVHKLEEQEKIGSLLGTLIAINDPNLVPKDREFILKLIEEKNWSDSLVNQHAELAKLVFLLHKHMSPHELKTFVSYHLKMDLVIKDENQKQSEIIKLVIKMMEEHTVLQLISKLREEREDIKTEIENNIDIGRIENNIDNPQVGG